MYELAMPGSLTVFPTPEATLTSPKPGLRHGLLLWVLAGHAAAFWLAFDQSGTAARYVAPQVLSVRWIAAEHRPEPPPPSPARATPVRTVPHHVHHAVEPMRAEPQAAPKVEPPVPATPPAPVEAKPVTPTPLEPSAPTRAEPAPPPVAEPVPPSFHADYLANPAPVYPQLSRRLGEEGTVRLRVLVSAAGLPLEVRLTSSSGHPRLDQAALDALAGWRFVPAHLGSQAVAGWVVVPISFSLRR